MVLQNDPKFNDVSNLPSSLHTPPSQVVPVTQKGAVVAVHAPSARREKYTGTGYKRFGTTTRFNQ